MNERASRLPDYLDHMAEAIGLAIRFTEGMAKEAFLADRKTQQAVILNLIVLGEAATKIATEIPGFVAAHPELPWQQMRGMRNRMAHGYFDINLDVVWETLRTALPDLARRIAAVKPESTSAPSAHD